MAQRKRLATVSVDYGRLVLLTFDAATGDGIVSIGEQRTLRDQMDCWQRTAVAADLSQALGHALERGIGDQAYLTKLVGAYQTSIDEVEPLEAA